MSNYYKRLSRDGVLANLYIRVSEKSPSAQGLSNLATVDFYHYTGLFYYYNTYTRFDISADIMAYFDFTIEELLMAVNANTADDFMLIPMDSYGMYQLIDKNGDSVERILVNAQKLDAYIRTIDLGFGIELYPIKYNKWIVMPASVADDDEFINEYRSFIKKISSNQIEHFYFVDSTGEIEELQL